MQTSATLLVLLLLNGTTTTTTNWPLRKPVLLQWTTAARREDWGWRPAITTTTTTTVARRRRTTTRTDSPLTPRLPAPLKILLRFKVRCPRVVPHKFRQPPPSKAQLYQRWRQQRLLQLQRPKRQSALLVNLLSKMVLLQQQHQQQPPPLLHLLESRLKRPSKWASPLPPLPLMIYWPTLGCTTSVNRGHTAVHHLPRQHWCNMAMVVQRRPFPQPVDWALLPPSQKTLPPVRVLLARTSHQRIKEHLIFFSFHCAAKWRQFCWSVQCTLKCTQCKRGDT